MIKANVISSFIFIQAHKVNMGKNSQLFLDAFLNLHFSAVLKKTFPCFTSQKVYARPLIDALSGHTQPTPPLPSPWDTRLSNDLCLFTGWGMQAVPGQGSSWQPQVPVFWLHESSRVWGRAATELCRKGGGWKWHQLLWLLQTPGLSYFFFLWTCISDGWKWKSRSSALTSVCTSWVNTCLDTTWHNARSNCWLQFAMVSSIKPFQHFTTNWPQLRR